MLTRTRQRVFAADHDVLVLGAGPAGASAAIRLAEMGLDVGIVERSRFPRGHVGICISDETVALIDFLGLADDFRNARFWRRNLTAVRWADADTRLVPQRGYHVDRAALDSLMLHRSSLAGVRVYQPAQVHQVDLLEDSAWTVAVASDSGPHFLRARFVVEATGRRTAIRGARVKDGPPLLAIHATWTPKSMCEFDGLIEAGDGAWLWYAQNTRHSAVVLVFCDPRHLRAVRIGDLQVKYRSLLDQFSAARLGQMGQQFSAPRACDATSHHADDPVGDQYIRLGDLCFCIDPLSSQGVHLALQSGLQGAIIVNTILRKPENTKVAQRFFRTSVAGRVARYSNRTRQEYGRISATFQNAFWQERSGHTPTAPVEESHLLSQPLPGKPSDQVVISPDVIFAMEPVIDGAFVEVRQVVRHPSFDGDIKYVEGVDLVRLLSVLPRSFAYGDIPELWQRHIPPAAGRSIAAWLWGRRILVRAAA